MNSFQKYLKDNIKKFDILSFFNYLKLLDLYDLSRVLFLPNISFKSTSTFFEEILFHPSNNHPYKITVFINFPLPFNFKIFLNYLKNNNRFLYKEIVNIIASFYQIIFSKLTNNKNNYPLNNINGFLNFNLFYYLAKNIFCDYKIDIKVVNSSFNAKKKSLFTLGDKLTLNENKDFYIIYIYSDNPILVHEFYNKHKYVLINLKKHATFKIVNIILGQTNKLPMRWPCKMSVKEYIIFHAPKVCI